MLKKMSRYLKEVGARFPKINPDYDPEVYKQQEDYEDRARWGAFEGQRPLEEDEM